MGSKRSRKGIELRRRVFLFTFFLILLSFLFVHLPAFVPPSASPQSDNDKVDWVIIVHFTGNKTRYQALIRSWFDAANSTVGFVLLTPDTFLVDSPWARHVFHRKDKHIHKTISGFALALQTYPQARFFTKADDDTFIYQKALFDQLSSQSGNFYSGLRCSAVSLTKEAADRFNISFYENFRYRCGGTYSFNRELIHSIVENYEEKFLGLKTWEATRGVVGEDVSMGLRVLDTVKQPAYAKLLHANPGYFDQGPWESYVPVDTLSRPLSYHHIPPERMTQLFHRHQLLGVETFPVLPRLFHVLEGHNIATCQLLNPKWEFRSWNAESMDKEREAFLSFREVKTDVSKTCAGFLHVLIAHGGLFLPPNVKCQKPVPEDSLDLQEATLLSSRVILARKWSPAVLLLCHYFPETDSNSLFPNPALDFSSYFPPSKQDSDHIFTLA